LLIVANWLYNLLMQQVIECTGPLPYNPFMGEWQNIDFPALCRLLRDAGGWTQEDMAKMFNVHLSTWKRWEGGKREPTAQAAFRLCRMLQDLETEKTRLNSELRKRLEKIWLQRQA
jgi:DNA-binding XRE family transcriptional regulator